MSAQYPFAENDNFKSENVLNSTVLVEDGVVWNQEEVQVSLSYSNDPNDTLTENNNESYLTATEGSNDTQYFSVLETTSETILNDLNDITTVCTEENSESTENEQAINNVCTIGGQPDIYRIEGSDELYAFEIAYDQEGNIQRFRYRLRPNENGEYESVPESIELLSLENESESDTMQPYPVQISDEQEQENTQPLMHPSIKIFVKEEYPHESILPDISNTLDESNVEDSGDELRVNEDEPEMTFEEDSGERERDTKTGIVGHNLLAVNKIEAVNHYKSEETTAAFDETFFEDSDHNDIPALHSEDDNHHIDNNEVHSTIHTNDLDSENLKQVCGLCDEDVNDSEEDTDAVDAHEQTNYQLLITENQESTEEHMFTKQTEDQNAHQSDDDPGKNSVESPSEENEEHFENGNNIEYLEDVTENESDTDEFQIVDGVHVTADTETHEDASDIIEAYIEKEPPAQHQILKLQQQYPTLQSTINDAKIKKINNKNINKVNKGYMYYVVKHPEKENVATIAHHVVPNKVIKTNPRSVLKSSYSYFEQRNEKEKLQVQKIEKKLPKSKEAMQARVLHNFIAKTTIIHAPIRQQRLPRKQTIKPVERADEEIIVQEVVVSSNGFIETSEDGVVKSKVPLKPTEIVQLSDSDDDYDPKRENKKKKQQKKRKSKASAIVISDTEEEISDENVVQIDLSTDSDEENGGKNIKDQEADKTKRLRKVSQKSEREPSSVLTASDSVIKKRRGRPPKRRTSATEETSTTDGSSSSKKPRRSTKDSLESSESNESKSEEQTSATEVQNIKTKWKCTECPKTLPSQGSLRSHMQYHNFHEPNNRNLRQSVSNVIKKPESNISLPKNKYECSVCKETFKNNFLLMNHKKQHTSNNKSLECSICKKVFADRSQLTSHKRTHIKEQMFKTTTLPKHSPKNTAAIRRTSMKSPKKTASFKCTVCTRVFSTLLLLNVHTKTHKHFTCSTCAASFISKLALEDHVRQNCVKQIKPSVRRLSWKTRKSLLAPPQRVSKRISLRRSLGKKGVRTSSAVSGSSSTDTDKKKLGTKLSLQCDSCTITFPTHAALFKHKVMKHGLDTPDKNIHKNHLKKKTLHKELGKHGSVPAGDKMRTAFTNLRTMFDK